MARTPSDDLTPEVQNRTLAPGAHADLSAELYDLLSYSTLTIKGLVELLNRPEEPQVQVSAIFLRALLRPAADQLDQCENMALILAECQRAAASTARPRTL